MARDLSKEEMLELTKCVKREYQKMKKLSKSIEKRIAFMEIGLR